jgi:hypothetical protein
MPRQRCRHHLRAPKTNTSRVRVNVHVHHVDLPTTQRRRRRRFCPAENRVARSDKVARGCRLGGHIALLRPCAISLMRRVNGRIMARTGRGAAHRPSCVTAVPTLSRSASTGGSGRPLGYLSHSETKHVPVRAIFRRKRRRERPADVSAPLSGWRAWRSGCRLICAGGHAHGNINGRRLRNASICAYRSS